MRQHLTAHRKSILIFFVFLLAPTTVCISQASMPPQSNEQLEGLIREPLSLRVTFVNGQQAMLDAFVTRPDKPGKWPVALLTNGADGTVQLDRELLNPNRFSSPAIAFARHGYAAVVVLRQGYGHSTGQRDYQGNTCATPRHARAGKMARADILAALTAIREQPWASGEKAVLIGLSAGGFSVLAASALNPPSVQAIINFDGGRGARNDGLVCDKNGLLTAIKSYGQTARVPTLWIYSANDKLFSPELSKEMFDAYRHAGGNAELFHAPAFRDNGHDFLVSAPENFWWQRVEQFLKQHTLPIREIAGLPKAPLPLPAELSPSGRKAFAEYQAGQTYEKAFATNGEGAWGSAIWARTQQEAANQAMAFCQKNRRKNTADCTLYATGNHVITDR
ncbi:alpha/beta hydrolase family protein [Serratia bockelmannii]|uniref:alpha/beta hydrolase family protein n=1 Tax=Serratia bockelmannii TaxID=2703793 RepID=UPI003FA73838